VNKTPIKKFLETCSQADLGAAVGLTQGAISKMVRTGRNVYVVTDSRNKIKRLVEEKPIAPSA
jgi:hypothetical protein